MHVIAAITIRVDDDAACSVTSLAVLAKRKLFAMDLNDYTWSKLNLKGAATVTTATIYPTESAPNTVFYIGKGLLPREQLHTINLGV